MTPPPPAYSPPVGQLLSLGPAERPPSIWLDYLGLGLSSEHAPELIRMSVDQALHQAPGDSPHVWAPVHAWRALGQLRVTSAAGELLEFVDGSDDDWALTDLPHVLSMMGSGILPELTSFFHDSTRGEWARGTVIDAMTQLARAEPDRREGVVASLSLQLSRWYRNEHILNSFIISALIDLEAVESAPLMETVFREGAVDETMHGDWEDVQVELGLLQERLTPRRRGEDGFPALARMSLRGTPAPRRPSKRVDPKTKRKSRQKAAQAARRRNRKRK